jgi:hypothetical protein
MAYSQEDIESIFKIIISEIENGASLRSCLRKDNRPSSSTFFIWIDEDIEKSKQYERAVELRSEYLFDEIIEIADKQGEDVSEDKDGNRVINHNIVQRNRLQIDARKWALSKMLPKKYGDKLDMTSGGEKLQSTPSAINVRIIEPNDED